MEHDFQKFGNNSIPLELFSKACWDVCLQMDDHRIGVLLEKADICDIWISNNF